MGIGKSSRLGRGKCPISVEEITLSNRPGTFQPKIREMNMPLRLVSLSRWCRCALVKNDGAGRNACALRGAVELHMLRMLRMLWFLPNLGGLAV
jgi:hypothetical protein